MTQAQAWLLIAAVYIVGGYLARNLWERVALCLAGLLFVILAVLT